jgi:hypothetical protein
MHDNVEDAAGVHEGDVLAGKYRIEKVLGIGGMGVVVAARHLQLETKVAIKFLLPNMLANKEAVARFAREARAAVKITGEHVARVLDVGTLETGAPFMVMEFLDGGDLSAWIQQRGALPVDQAVEFLLHACVAVAEAHSLGIVHRDLKPANLFCIRRADGKASIKVLDFGISKVTDLSGTDGGMSMTKTSTMMGSPLYMSPEQMHSPKEVDAQTDVWALGVILYELLTGRVPFDGDTVPEVAIKVATAQPPPLRDLRPDAPPGLEAVILRCLGKTKQTRYTNIAELALGLADYAPARAKASIDRICGILQVSGPASMAPEAQEPIPGGSGVAAGTMAAVGRTTAGMNGSKKRVAALGVLGAVVALGLVSLGAFVVGRKPVDADRHVAAAALVPPPATAAPSAAPPPADTDARLAALPPDPPPGNPRPAPPAVATPPGPAKAASRVAAPVRPSSAPAVAAPPAAPPATPPPAVAPAPRPAPAPAPAARGHNQLDLGNFQ